MAKFNDLLQCLYKTYWISQLVAICSQRILWTSETFFKNQCPPFGLTINFSLTPIIPTNLENIDNSLPLVFDVPVMWYIHGHVTPTSYPNRIYTQSNKMEKNTLFICTSYGQHTWWVGSALLHTNKRKFAYTVRNPWQRRGTSIQKLLFVENENV